ncbi:helix-turn-helix domain-containing protein [Staphylococcus equorum]|uniref:helix-turn-helix domain-containing protein n=1 Tax=Staphylococcus equorum TaxID=246432 RepID=UPI000D1CF9D3|nr:helix-turn-helix domain-containing protein [Staphylococcus equorum]PTE43393.1 helix-turn-helix domain-containing protein [Staphylococcus equorum]RIL46379.1 helix-turn-helix domain-containing protein [Staphylococcus equorum]
MPKVTTPPNPENTLIGEEKFVKKLYAKATHIHTMFDVSRSTVYKWLREYDQDDLGIKNLYIDYSASMTLINIAKLENYLIERHKKWM